MSHKKAIRWLFSASVTKQIKPDFSQPTRDSVPESEPEYTVPVPSPDPVEVKSRPLGWILDPRKGLELPELERIRRSESTEFLSERVLARLQQIEAHEAEASYRDDIRIAWLTVLHCQRGDAVECTPHVLATYEVLGCHPEKVYAKTILRRVAMFGATAKILQMPKRSVESSGQVSPETTTTSSEHVGTVTAYQERGIGPDSVPSPKSSPNKSDEEKSA